jgi:hypothetical protein
MMSGPPVCTLPSFTRLGTVVVVALFTLLRPGVASAGPFAYPLRVLRGHLFDRGGRPFFYQGDSAPGLLVKLERDQAVEFLRDRRIRGFTAVESALTLRNTRDREGNLPFTDDDLNRPEPRYFDRVDQVARTAEALGLLLALTPVESLTGRCTVERCRELGHWLGDHFKRFANVMWVMAGTDAPWAALAQGLAETAPDHLVAGREDAPFTQLRFTRTLDRCRAPCVLEAPPAPLDDPRAVRQRGYQAVLAGAVGDTYLSVVSSLGPSWRAQLGSPGSASLIHLRTLLDTRPWDKLEPESKLAGAAVSAARASDGSFALVYLPSPQLLKIDARRLSGRRVIAWWWNPRTGESKRAGILATTGSFPLQPPSAAPQDDWVLVLDDAASKFRRPGDDGEAPGPAARAAQ